MAGWARAAERHRQPSLRVGLASHIVFLASICLATRSSAKRAGRPHYCRGQRKRRCPGTDPVAEISDPVAGNAARLRFLQPCNLRMRSMTRVINSYSMTTQPMVRPLRPTTLMRDHTRLTQTRTGDAESQTYFRFPPGWGRDTVSPGVPGTSPITGSPKDNGNCGEGRNGELGVRN